MGTRGWLAVLAMGCAFDSSTLGGSAAIGSTGDGSTSLPTTTSTSNGSTSSTTDDPGSESSTTSSSSTGEPDSTTESSSSDSSSSSSSTTDACGELVPFATLLWVQDLPGGSLVDMDLLESASIELDGQPVVYARSLVEDVGSVTFDFEIDCDDDVYFWGLVFDWNVATGSGPDSFWYGVDADAAVNGDAWVYGCTTSASGWSWEPIERFEGSRCDTDLVMPTLAAGSHTLTLLNREDGEETTVISDYAGVAALAISNDPAYDPYTDYAP